MDCEVHLLDLFVALALDLSHCQDYAHLFYAPSGFFVANPQLSSNSVESHDSMYIVHPCKVNHFSIFSYLEVPEGIPHCLCVSVGVGVHATHD